ncbi:MAG TPA: sigma 54-interacting transcriptional regulator, partial [Anaeromyxobacteraceae bacterium]
MSEPARDAAFAAVSTAFGSIGRVCMALDAEFHVRHVSSHLDVLLGPGAATRIVGQPIETLLGSELFAPGSALRQALTAGEKREGWRALLHSESGATRLLSITAAPLQRDPYGVCDPSAVYLLVLRPAEDDPACAGSREPVAGPGLMCRSQAMARVFRLVETLQHSESSILITGESGTGKEVMARTLHAHS